MIRKYVTYGVPTRGASSFSGIISAGYVGRSAGKRIPFSNSLRAVNLTNQRRNVHDTRSMSLNGVIVIDKPSGWTSHDVVAKMRNILGERSIGHLGTLDPMATGVLPLVIGKMTRLCQFYEHSEKAYEGTIRFGFATDTYDADGDPAGPPQEVKVTLEEIARAQRRASWASCSRFHRRFRPRRSRVFRPTSWRARSRTLS